MAKVVGSYKIEEEIRDKLDARKINKSRVCEAALKKAAEDESVCPTCGAKKAKR